jgi:hypothetical protein
MLRHEYGREALKLGLKLEGELGANPFKFGLIGSTDLPLLEHQSAVRILGDYK